eukprot:jgi/Botrbrau1/13382/Bobra.0194s0013.2
MPKVKCKPLQEVSALGHAAKIGDCLLVKAVEGELPYIGEVRKIIECQTVPKTYKLSLAWFYRPEEALGGRKTFHGRQELFRSNHEDEVYLETVLGRCSVHTVEEYVALESPGETDFFVRMDYDPSKREFSPDEVSVFCLCNLPYNPDRFMSQCVRCKEW